MQYLITTQEQALNLYHDVLELVNKGHKVGAETKVKTARTLNQNSALHLWCDQMAKTLNAAGLDQRVVLKPEVEIPWTQEAVKESLWRPIQIIVLGVESTTEPGRNGYGEVYDVLNRHMINKHNVHVPWPTKERV